MKITKNFSLQELTNSDVADRLGIYNKPANKVITNLVVLAEVLERVRKKLGIPIFITSGYRSQEVNTIVGGSSKSKHMIGLAADFKCKKSPYETCKLISKYKEEIGYECLIKEYGWTHIEFPTKGNIPKYRELTKMSANAPYIHGIQP